MERRANNDASAKLEGIKKLLDLDPVDWEVIKQGWEKKPDGTAVPTGRTEDQSTWGNYREGSEYPSGTSEEDESMDYTIVAVNEFSRAKLSAEADNKKDYGINHVDSVLETTQNAINYTKSTLQVVDMEEEYTEQMPIISSTVGEQDKNQENLVQPGISAPSTSIPKSTGGSQALSVTTDITADNLDSDGQSDSTDELHKDNRGLRVNRKRNRNRSYAPNKKCKVDQFRADRHENQGVSKSVSNNPPTTKNGSDMREFEEFMKQVVELACDPKKLLKLVNERLSRNGMSGLRLSNEDPIDGVTFQEGEVEWKKRFIELYREIETKQKIREDLRRNGLV